MFDALSMDQKRLMVRLPYRVGLYVSESDRSGGGDADAQEMQVLSNLLYGFGQDVMGAESIQHVISTTLALDEQWSEWGEDLHYVPAECDQIVELLNAHVSEKDARAFAVQMYEIGEAVALAFQEYEEGSFIDTLKLRWRYWQDQAFARKNKQRETNFEQYKSISADERAALRKIAKGLGLAA